MSEPRLHPAHDLSMPLDAITETFGILAARGMSDELVNKLREAALAKNGQCVLLELAADRIEAEVRQRICRWLSSGDGLYVAGCDGAGLDFCSIPENAIRFCIHCGKPVEILSPKEERYDPREVLHLGSFSDYPVPSKEVLDRGIEAVTRPVPWFSRLLGGEKWHR